MDKGKWDIRMSKIADYIKLGIAVFTILFATVGFLQTLFTLNPRLVALEGRMSRAESKVSMIETKLDILLKQGSATQSDVKDIYRLMISEGHSR